MTTLRSGPAAPRGMGAESVLAQPDLRTLCPDRHCDGEFRRYTGTTGWAHVSGLAGVRGDGVPRSIAVVVSAAAPSVVTRFDTVDTLAVRVEPAGGSAKPTTTPIASLGLA